jgi:2-desacetyl-2-hydroxyethyl bacteriochlorophyllide A dehydrogenase
MRAAVLTAPRRFDLREVPLPAIGPDDVLIRVTRTGICGTDIHIWNGHYAADRLPLIPGHEFVGYVAAPGANVRHLAQGTRVVADINIGCGTCYWCRRNEVLNCPAMTQVGIGRDGAFATHVALPARLAIPVPDHLSDAEAALTEPVACVVRAARKARATFAQSVLILGAGPVGNLHIQMMRLIGAAPIIVIEPHTARADLARGAGADVVVTDPAALEEAVMSATAGRGVDLAIESVGKAALYATAARLIRKGGHLAFFGLTGPGETHGLDILQTILQENSLKGSVAGMGQDMHDALTLLSHRRFATAAFTRATWPIDRIANAFATLPDRPGDLKTQIILPD